MPSENSTNNGHRSRLRSKFLQNGFSGFLDYEIIELLLTISTPRKDCKQNAKFLISKYKTVSGVINASEEELKQVKGIGESSIIGIKLAKEANLIISREAAQNNEFDISDTKELIYYLRNKIGFLQKETFIILCCDTKGNLIDESISIGTLNSSLVHPREVFTTAITNHAAQIIVAHNHPSGDASPSDDDVLTTRKLVEAGKIIGIDVLDHFIVSRNDSVSMKKLGFV